MRDEIRKVSRPGRPRTVCNDRQQGSVVSVYLPASYHDRLTQLASLREDGSVSAVVRELLIIRLT